MKFVDIQMNAFYRLDCRVLYRQIHQRWFVVAKPPGYTLQRTPSAPSVVSHLESKWNSDREEAKWFFPYSLEKEAQGIVVVTRDAALAHEITEGMLKRYRLLCSVDKPRPTNECALFEPLQGSLVDEEGNLLEHGELSSHLNLKPWRLRNDPSEPSVRSARSAGKPQDVPSILAHAVSKNRDVHSVFGNSHTTEFQCMDAENGIGYYVAQPLIDDRSTETSATHMIRAHFAHAGSPLLFDSHYHPDCNLARRKKTFQSPSYHKKATSDLDIGSSPLALQLFSIIFPDPFDPRKEVSIEMEAPEEWCDVLDIDVGRNNIEVRTKPVKR